VDVRRSDHHRQRDAASVDHKVAPGEPAFPLSVGFGPVFWPPFWRARLPSLEKPATNLSARPLRGGPKGLCAGAPTPRPLANL
jgi:hypothetical protein